MRSTRGKVLLMAIGLQVVIASLPQAQSPARESARFDAASIKPSSLDAIVGNGFRISPGRLLAVNNTVHGLVLFAYGLEPGDEGAISGGPQWTKSDRFEVEGKAEGAAALPELRAMLRTLLSERFKLRLHEEMRERDIYALTFARNDRTPGPALKPTAADEAAHCASIESDPQATPEFTPDGMRRCATSSRGGIRLRGRPIDDLARLLGELVGRPVIDRTGLGQRFDADLAAALNWDHLALGGPSDTLGVNAVIFTALQEQLGLKLEAGRGPIRTLVIDSVEKPTPD
jgi:uncharacterized protein (TIGR03435 family)